MSIKFDPRNSIVQICLKGMELEDKERTEEAATLFQTAWNEAQNDLERYLAAYYVARLQKSNSGKLRWLETALGYAEKIDDDTVKSAFPALYLKIAQCYEALGDADKAKINSELSDAFRNRPSDKGPFYHGTKAALQIGDFLTAGGTSNYKANLKMNHIYFTALINGAGLAAALAKGDGNEHVYIIEPTGKFENDPNVTDQKFPGNPTRSYRSQEPLKIVGEVTEWARQTPEEIAQWRRRLAQNTEEIIN